MWDPFSCDCISQIFFQLRKSKEAFSVLRGRSSSLSRRGLKGGTGKRLPALPPIARKSTDAAKSDFPTSATANGEYCGKFSQPHVLSYRAPS